MGAGGADNVVLIDAVSTDPNRADEHTIAVKWKAAWENRDAVRQISSDTIAQRRGTGRCGVCRSRKRDVGLGARKPGKLILLGEERPRIVAINSGRIKALREKADRPCRHRDVQPESREIVARIKQSGACFLH